MATDQELVVQALENPQSFSRIVDRYQTPLRRYIIRLGCRNHEDTDDVLQDIFLKCYLNLNEYDQRLKFSSWIYRLAHNETVSFFRKKTARPSTVQTKEELGLFDALRDKTNILESLNEKMNAQYVREVLGEMDESYRDVLILRFLEEKSYDEISDILKIPAGTVAILIFRGKKRLKNIMISKNVYL